MSQILRLALPWTLWLIGFSALYGLQGLTCSRHWPEGIAPRTALVAAAALHVLMQGLVLAQATRPAPSRFAQQIAMMPSAAALAAALWTSLPVLSVTICN
ncbi:MAG: hypothetical protein ACLGIE_07010 [Alphaproteobacteria bacterium]